MIRIQTYKANQNHLEEAILHQDWPNGIELKYSRPSRDGHLIIELRGSENQINQALEVFKNCNIIPVSA